MTQTEQFAKRISELEARERAAWQVLTEANRRAAEITQGPLAEWSRLQQELHTLQAAVKLLSEGGGQ